MWRWRQWLETSCRAVVQVMRLLHPFGETSNLNLIGEWKKLLSWLEFGTVWFTVTVDKIWCCLPWTDSLKDSKKSTLAVGKKAPIPITQRVPVLPKYKSRTEPATVSQNPLSRIRAQGKTRRWVVNWCVLFYFNYVDYIVIYKYYFSVGENQKKYCFLHLWYQQMCHNKL